MVEARKATINAPTTKTKASSVKAPLQAAKKGAKTTVTKPNLSAAAASKPTPGRAAAGGSKMVGAQRDDYECPVCLELCAQPVLTPCKHFMCFQCNKRVVASGMTCPMCRAHFDKLFIPQIDAELQEQIAREMGTQFEERKAALQAEGEWLGNMKLVKFAFGNTHEDVEKPQASRTGGTGVKNSHRWCMFMSLNGSPEETNKFIKSVTYHLHPTFKPSKIKLEQAPFLLSRVGWGTFDVEMDIEFQPSTGLGKHHLTHELTFSGQGKTQSILLEVDGDNSDVSMAKQLATEFKKLNVEEQKRQ